MTSDTLAQRVPVGSIPLRLEAFPHRTSGRRESDCSSTGITCAERPTKRLNFKIPAMVVPLTSPSIVRPHFALYEGTLSHGFRHPVEG